ncbi:unnamed protein product [Laminaria digitata]
MGISRRGLSRVTLLVACASLVPEKTGLEVQIYPRGCDVLRVTRYTVGSYYHHVMSSATFLAVTPAPCACCCKCVRLLCRCWKPANACTGGGARIRHLCPGLVY